MTEQVTETGLDDEPEDNMEIIRAKWKMDDAATLPEAAAKIRAFADELDKLHRDGYRLEQPIADDYGFLIPPEPSR